MRFDLVTIDLDGTLLPGDTAFGVILRDNGKRALADAVDRRFAHGEISLQESFLLQWQEIKGLALADLHRALRKANWLPGIGEGVRRLKESGCKVALLTDQPSTVTDFLGRWGLSDAICSPVTVKEGKQTAIDTRFDKLANLQAHLQQWSIPESKVCHVGNGTNDIPVFEKVGGSVAVYAASQQVEKAATMSLARPPSLDAILDAVFAQ